MHYLPKPIDTAHLNLPPELARLAKALAQNAQELLAQQRIKDATPR
jgi:hypothetical protein